MALAIINNETLNIVQFYKKPLTNRNNTILMNTVSK